MSRFNINTGLSGARCHNRQARMTRFAWALFAAAALVCGLSAAASVSAQKRFSQRYPARQNARVQITNRFGTITVEAWDRNEIKIAADMDSPAARLAPEQTDDGIVINVVRDNQNRAEIGDVNFRIFVPANSVVDVETKRGNITVRNVQGAMVRAHVTLEGSIELTGIHAASVMAQNTLGDIFFDGELVPDGRYEFKSTQGNMNIRIPASSSFSLVATAPFTRGIDLGMFSNHGGLNHTDGRKIVGNINDGRATLTLMNQRGRISFLRR